MARYLKALLHTRVPLIIITRARHVMQRAHARLRKNMRVLYALLMFSTRYAMMPAMRAIYEHYCQLLSLWLQARYFACIIYAFAMPPLLLPLPFSPPDIIYAFVMPFRHSFDVFATFLSAATFFFALFSP